MCLRHVSFKDCLYSLESAWMNKNLLKKLDGFYAKCLRQILKISPSFISRVTNEFVLQQFNTQPLSTILLKRQLQLFGKVARMPNHNVVRESVFEHDSIDMKQSGNRRRGRPRNTWTNEFRKRALIICQDADMLATIMSKESWDAKVKTFLA